MNDLRNIRDTVNDKLDRLEQIRNAKGKTLEEFSQELGVSRATYHNWQEQNRLPKLEHWFKIKEYLEG